MQQGMPSRPQGPFGSRGQSARRVPPSLRSEGDENEEDNDVDEDSAPDFDAYGRNGEGNPRIVAATVIKGVDRARERLVPWFRKIIDSVEEQQNPLQVSLVQTTSQAGDSHVTEIPHDLESPPDDTIDELLRLATDDISEGHFSGAKISYAILVPRQSRPNRPERFTFILEKPTVGSALNDPPQRQHFPDAPGVISQFMTQNLQLTQMTLEQSNVGMDRLMRHNDRLEEEIRFLKRRQFTRDQEMQILMDGNLKRQMMIDEHRSKIDRDAKIGEGFKALMPQILPLILPPNMAQTLQAVTGSGMPGMPGMQGVPTASPVPQGDPSSAAPPTHQGGHANAAAYESNVVDELIHEIEDDQTFFLKLFNLMAEKPRAAELIGTLYQMSVARRRAREGK